MKSFGTSLSTVVLAVLLMTTVIHGEQRILQQGMVGSDVRQLQQVLTDLGYVTDVDGVFGQDTRRVLQQFQAAAGLIADGIAGSKTFGVLDKLHQLEKGTYTVRSGDSLYSIAARYDTTIRVITALNNLDSAVIQPNQSLVVPKSVREHVVAPGESLSLIASRFGVPLSELVSANQLSNPDRLMAGQVLQIPVNAVPVVAAAPSTPNFSWPVRGRISSPYGWRIHPITQRRDFHGGIDIAVPHGTLVRASAPGTVTLAGWMGTYGQGIVIEHDARYTTWYGHNSKLLVRAGDTVSQGQPIAHVGSTGMATGPHLDFRIKINDQTVDPMHYLP